MIPLCRLDFLCRFRVAENHAEREEEQDNPARDLKRPQPQPKVLKQILPAHEEPKQDQTGNQYGPQRKAFVQSLWHIGRREKKDGKAANRVDHDKQCNQLSQEIGPFQHLAALLRGLSRWITTGFALCQRQFPCPYKMDGPQTHRLREL